MKGHCEASTKHETTHMILIALFKVTVLLFSSTFITEYQTQYNTYIMYSGIYKTPNRSNHTARPTEYMILITLFKVNFHLFSSKLITEIDSLIGIIPLLTS